MATKIPEKILVNRLLDNLQKSASKWSVKKDEQGNEVLDTTTHNTALVIRALSDAAREAGYISLMFALISCKIDKLD